MNVDDVGRRAGATLRSQFDGMSAPLTDLAEGRRPRSRRRAVLVGAAVMVLVALVAAGLVLARPEPTPTSGPGGSWKRVSMRAAFGPHVTATQIIVGGPGFVALGSVGSSANATVRPSVWTSSDGLHWDAVPARFPSSSSFFGFTNVVERGGVFIAVTQLKNELWRSTDLKTWRRVARLSAPETALVYVTAATRGFIAPGAAGSPADSVAWTSIDGRHWSRVAGSGSAMHPVGLEPSARLNGQWLSLSAETPTPSVFRSRNGVHWTLIPVTNAPERFALPLVNNHRRTRVLGIQFEHYEKRYSFGGRLWSTRDGATWSEIPSFREQMPVANPDHLVQSGRWWLLGGNTGAADGLRRASMWSSPDLLHWYEMPRHLQGHESGGDGVFVVAHGSRVLGFGGRFVWVWSPPR